MFKFIQPKEKNTSQEAEEFGRKNTQGFYVYLVSYFKPHNNPCFIDKEMEVRRDQGTGLRSQAEKQQSRALTPSLGLVPKCLHLPRVFPLSAPFASFLASREHE